MAKKSSRGLGRFVYNLHYKHTGKGTTGMSYIDVVEAVYGVRMTKSAAKAWLVENMDDNKRDQKVGCITLTKLARLLYEKKFGCPASHPRLKVVLIVQDLTGKTMERADAANWVRSHEHLIPELIAHREGLAKPIKKVKPKKVDYKKKKKASEDFYWSREWRAIRYLALKRHGASCLACGRSAKDGIIIHVDHVKPRSKYPELELNVNNLQILCEDCNLGKSNIDETDWR